MISKLATSYISDLDCVADQTVLGVVGLETLITGFVVSQPRPNKKNIPVFRVTQPYLNLLVKPRFFFQVSKKNIIFYIFTCLSKCIKIIFISRKKIKIKNICAYPT